MQGRLKELGIRRFQDLASLTPRDVKGLSETLGLDARVSLENWIGQAHVLAAGGETHYSRRIDQGVPVPEAAEPSGPAPAAPAAVEAPAPQAAAPAQSAPAPVSAAAASAPAPAAGPAAGGDNGFPVSDVAHLRSVRSEALIGEEGARAQGRPFSDADDLKRIRGIGVLIEKKLNSLGITHFEQVANWTGADIERISRILDFKGRIEREHWIEQARILATGGQTEFSRRN
jgi:predicted flap endonuclease-1-like 5' DNA nuclease